MRNPGQLRASVHSAAGVLRSLSSWCAVMPCLLALILAGCATTRETPAEDVVATDKVTTFLMFQDGRAEEAMNFYISLFDDAEVTRVDRYGPEGPVLGQHLRLMLAP